VLRVCAISLRGVSPPWEKRFAPAIAALIGQGYSRVSLEGLTLGEVETTLRTRGLLDATVGAPDARLNDGCDGVTVTVAVAEGSPYTWDRTTWNGNTMLATAELDRLLGARVGAIADTVTLDAGLMAIRAAYAKTGHVQAQLSVSTRRDEATKRARLDVNVVEGAQFQMGALQLAGLTETDAANLTKRWKLKPGHVFDASYLDEFRRSSISPLQQQRRLGVRGPIVTADVAAKVVHVRYEFRQPER
jgi:outer membrane translocation and assembly module TamA